MKNKEFEVHAYVKANYSFEAIENYEEAFGINGMDHLWSMSSPEEVDELLSPFED